MRLSIGLLLAATLMLSACGQKGALLLPNMPEKPTSSNATVRPVEQPRS